MDIKELCNLIDENKEELFSLLGSFIRINSENYRTGGREKELAELIHKMALELGLESDIYSPLDLEGFKNHPDYMDGRHLEDRYNVTVAYKGEADENALMLMAHTDTVEIGDRASWCFDPLSGEVVDGKVLGRGACDDKYGIAVSLFIMKLLKKSGTPLLRCSNFGQSIYHLIVNLGDNVLNIALQDLLARYRRKNTDCYLIAPVHQPAIANHSIRTIQHDRKYWHSSILGKEECSSLEVMNLAITRACTLGEYRDRCTLLKPLQASGMHQSHSLLGASTIDNDIAMSIEQLTYDRDSIHLLL